MVAKLAPTNIPLLLIGENGTGKEILANRIHQLSLMSGQPLVKVICAFLNSESLSAHFKRSNNGKEEKGTLFCREISELDPVSQRTLQYSLPQEELTATQRCTGPRFIASTTRNLEEEVRNGLFRADLYYQITAASITLVPLRRRAEDIPAFVELFLMKHSTLLGRPRPHLDSEDFVVLQKYSWPGNIRELENVVRRIVALNDPKAVLSPLLLRMNDTPITHHLGKTFPMKAAARAAYDRTQRQLILDTLAKNYWNRKRAAQELQISYKSLLNKLKQMRAEEEKPVQG